VTTYFTADWHLGHQRIIELCDRPFSDAHQMNRQIIRNCNALVGEADTLMVLGDTVLGTYAANVQLLQQIRCNRVVMIPGNHDRWSYAYRGTDARREEARLGLTRLGMFPQADRKPSRWRSSVQGRAVLLSHYPYAGTDGERFPELRPADEGLPLLHGHVHEKWRENGRMLNVGVDVWDFMPVSEHSVVLWLEGLERESD
jgi:calcineurin-like phosphoesterase family protein